MKTTALLLALLVTTGITGFAKGGGHSGGHSASSSSKSSSSSSKVHVKGYTKKDGTYVAPHDRTTPDHTQMNNWSTKGNTNPETGKAGTKEPVK